MTDYKCNVHPGVVAYCTIPASVGSRFTVLERVNARSFIAAYGLVEAVKFMAFCPVLWRCKTHQPTSVYASASKEHENRGTGALVVIPDCYLRPVLDDGEQSNDETETAEDKEITNQAKEDAVSTA